MVLAGRLPVPASFDWPLLHLGTLPTNDAIQLLGDHLEEDLRRRVAKALDGHPMALNLYREGQLDLDGLVTNTYDLDGVNDGYDDMRAAKNIRGVLVYD